MRHEIRFKLKKEISMCGNEKKKATNQSWRNVSAMSKMLESMGK